MRTLLNLSPNEREVFPKHFLNAVYAEVRFNELSYSYILENKASLKEHMKSCGFLKCDDLVEQQATLSTNNKDLSAQIQSTTTIVGLTFISQSPSRTVQINRNAIIISDFGYDSFESFSQRIGKWIEVILSVAQLPKETIVSKVGLRKVSSVIIKPIVTFESALSIFNPSLFSLARSGLLKPESLNVSEEVVQQESDGNHCILNTILKKKADDALEATLNFDLISLIATPYSEVFEKKLPSMNNVHYDLFMWAITDRMKELMRNPEC
jgi:uncharacterized protein (TIGR04255 family)